MRHPQVVACTGADAARHSGHWRQHRSAGGDEVVPPQDAASEIQVRRAADTGTAGGRARLSAHVKMMMETREEVRDAHGQDMLHRD